MSLCKLQVDKIKLRAKTKTKNGQIDSRNNNLAVTTLMPPSKLLTVTHETKGFLALAYRRHPQKSREFSQRNINNYLQMQQILPS